MNAPCLNPSCGTTAGATDARRRRGLCDACYDLARRRGELWRFPAYAPRPLPRALPPPGHRFRDRPNGTTVSIVEETPWAAGRRRIAGESGRWRSPTVVDELRREVAAERAARVGAA